MSCHIFHTDVSSLHPELRFQFSPPCFFVFLPSDCHWWLAFLILFRCHCSNIVSVTKCFFDSHAAYPCLSASPHDFEPRKNAQVCLRFPLVLCDLHLTLHCSLPYYNCCSGQYLTLLCILLHTTQVTPCLDLYLETFCSRFDQGIGMQQGSARWHYVHNLQTASRWRSFHSFHPHTVVFHRPQFPTYNSCPFHRQFHRNWEFLQCTDQFGYLLEWMFEKRPPCQLLEWLILWFWSQVVRGERYGHCDLSENHVVRWEGVGEDHKQDTSPWTTLHSLHTR